MTAIVIPFPVRKVTPQPIRYVTIDGEFAEDDWPTYLYGRSDALSARQLYITPAEYGND